MGIEAYVKENHHFVVRASTAVDSLHLCAVAPLTGLSPARKDTKEEHAEVAWSSPQELDHGRSQMWSIYLQTQHSCGEMGNRQEEPGRSWTKIASNM